MEKKVYILQLEWNVDGATEFEVRKVSDSLDTIKKYFKTDRDDIVYDWAKGEDFEIEEETDTLFEYQFNEWDKYYILKVIEKELV